MTEKSGTQFGTILVAFAAGAAAGAVTALLLAPRTGEETRSLLGKAARGAKDMVERVPDAVRQASGAARSAFDGSMNGGRDRSASQEHAA